MGLDENLPKYWKNVTRSCKKKKRCTFASVIYDNKIHHKTRWKNNVTIWLEEQSDNEYKDYEDRIDDNRFMYVDDSLGVGATYLFREGDRRE